jgi:hypothetical protein
MKVLEMRANKVTRRTIRQSSKNLLPTNNHQRTNLPTAKRFSHNPEKETQDQTPRTAVPVTAAAPIKPTVLRQTIKVLTPNQTIPIPMDPILTAQALVVLVRPDLAVRI